MCSITCKHLFLPWSYSLFLFYRSLHFRLIATQACFYRNGSRILLKGDVVGLGTTIQFRQTFKKKRMKWEHFGPWRRGSNPPMFYFIDKTSFYANNFQKNKPFATNGILFIRLFISPTTNQVANFWLLGKTITCNLSVIKTIQTYKTGAYLKSVLLHSFEICYWR